MSASGGWPGDPVDGSGAAAPAETGGPLLAGRYRLGELLGSGGMADVYRGVDERLGRPVAVKVFRPDAAPAEGMDRFHAETRVLAALNHPGLITLYDAGVDGPRCYLVTQLVEGTTLSRRLLDGPPLGPDETGRIGAALYDALAHVHVRGVVHRDVKPANVLLGDDGAPHLADFGIALLAGSTRLTATGCLVGTAAYLAPEQVADGPVGPPADVYSLGLVLLECLTGRREYTGDFVQAALGRLTRPPSIPESLPEPWRQALAAATERDPGDRPAAAELVALLRSPTPLEITDPAAATPVAAGPVAAGPVAAGPDTPVPVTAALPRHAPGQPEGRRRRIPARMSGYAAVALLVAVGVGVVLALLGHRSDRQAQPAEPTRPPAPDAAPHRPGGPQVSTAGGVQGSPVGHGTGRDHQPPRTIAPSPTVPPGQSATATPTAPPSSAGAPVTSAAPSPPGTTPSGGTAPLPSSSPTPAPTPTG